VGLGEQASDAVLRMDSPLGQHPGVRTSGSNLRTDAPRQQVPDPQIGHEAVDAQHLSKRFEKENQSNAVLSDITLSIPDGEFVSVIGPSGCGKSTMLKILAGLSPYDSGAVTVLGRRPGGSWRDVGFVFQHLALLPWRSVLGNVLLPAELAGVGRSEAMDRARASLDMVGLTGFERYHLREISGGMRQRVALARVLMSDARLLLLDEPFSALDEITREVVDLLFMDICVKTGAAAILVTHSLYEAVLMSDRVIVLSSRPAAIVGEVLVDSARPRARTFMEDGAFIQAAARVRELLEAGA
jgi:NitT/TauT family transport system ATP-binding protein